MRGVVNILGAWLKTFVHDWLSTSLLQMLDTPLLWPVARVIIQLFMLHSDVLEMELTEL